MPTTIVWPLELPSKVLLDPLERQPQDQALRTSMAAGPAKVRALGTVTWERFPIQMNLTADQVELLMELWRDSTRMGSVAFGWVHPTLQTDCTCRFLGPPVIKPITTFNAPGGETHTASFSIEVLPALEEFTITDPEIFGIRDIYAHRSNAGERNSAGGVRTGYSAPLAIPAPAGGGGGGGFHYYGNPADGIDGGGGVGDVGSSSSSSSSSSSRNSGRPGAI